MSRFLIITDFKSQKYHLHDTVIRLPRHLPESAAPLSRRMRTFSSKEDCVRYGEILEKINKPPTPEGMRMLT